MSDDTIETKHSNDLVRETERLCQRYIDEVVLPFSLCPWAAPALRNGGVQMSVIADYFEGTSSLRLAADTVLQTLAEITDESIELVLVLLPRCEYSRLEMDDLLREIRGPREGHSPRESEVSFALAAFHPDAKVDTTSPERFIPYLRRTPDPMIQAVRTSTLAKIDPTRGAGTAYFDLKNMDLEQLTRPAPESLRKRVARTNLSTCETKGLDTLAARFESILEDHRATRARLAGRKL